MNISAMRRTLVYGTCCLLGLPSLADARFLQVDPVGYEDQHNLYAYVGNDPLNMVDPTGQIMVPPDSIDPRRDWASRYGQHSMSASNVSRSRSWEAGPTSGSKCSGRLNECFAPRADKK